MTMTNTSAPEKFHGYYHSLPLADRAATSLEMAQEIGVREEQLYCLASALRDRLESDHAENESAIFALRLSELLEQLLSESEQMFNLIDCLKSVRDEVAA